MKSPALLLALALCFSLTVDTAAQHNAAPSFAIGIAPFSLVLPGGKFNLRSEWAYSGNRSLSLLISIPRATPAPALIGNNFDLSEDAVTTVNRFSSFGAVLEHRFYLGQNALHGFYVAPYGRYNKFSVERKSQNPGSQYISTVKGSAGGFGVGASAGVQFRLGDFLTLDATIAGVDLKWLNGTFQYTSDDPETDLTTLRNKVLETVGGIPFIGSKLVSEINGNAVQVRTPGLPVPAYRFNLTVNYVF